MKKQENFRNFADGNQPAIGNKMEFKCLDLRKLMEKESIEKEPNVEKAEQKSGKEPDGDKKKLVIVIAAAALLMVVVIAAVVIVSKKH